jgi:tight junction protein 1
MQLSFSSRKLFGGGGGNTNANNSASSEPMEELLMSGGGNGNYATSELAPPAYERVALKRPAFHRPVVLFGPLADVARQLLLTQSGLRFGAPLPSAGPSASGLAASASSEMAGSTTSSSAERGIRLAAVDSVMAAQRHCVLCVSPGSVERLQLAQYAPIVVLIDVDSRARVRELRTKAGANTQSARKLLEQATRIKKQHSHLLTATLDASKEDQWFEALRALIFHLQVINGVI